VTGRRIRRCPRLPVRGPRHRPTRVKIFEVGIFQESHYRDRFHLSRAVDSPRKGTGQPTGKVEPINFGTPTRRTPARADDYARRRSRARVREDRAITRRCEAQRSTGPLGGAGAHDPGSNGAKRAQLDPIHPRRAPRAPEISTGLLGPDLRTDDQGGTIPLSFHTQGYTLSHSQLTSLLPTHVVLCCFRLMAHLWALDHP
jgi:hypothetical protein